jgi:hypothetical protein
MTTKIGNLKRCVIQRNGSTLDITISESKTVPNLCANLLSTNIAMQNEFNVSNEGFSICLTKGSTTITFKELKTL